MFKKTPVFNSISVDDLQSAKEFYGEKLGLEVKDQGDMGFSLHFNGGKAMTFVYPKEDHQPATFTVLNFSVDDIDSAIDRLTRNGIQVEFYDDENLPQDEKGVLRGLRRGNGPDIAWFKDPAGNILSVLQEKKTAKQS